MVAVKVFSIGAVILALGITYYLIGLHHKDDLMHK